MHRQTQIRFHHRVGKSFDRQTCVCESRLKRTTSTNFVKTPQNLAHAVSNRQILSLPAGIRRAALEEKRVWYCGKMRSCTGPHFCVWHLNTLETTAKRFNTTSTLPKTAADQIRPRSTTQHMDKRETPVPPKMSTQMTTATRKKLRQTPAPAATEEAPAAGGEADREDAPPQPATSDSEREPEGECTLVQTPQLVLIPESSMEFEPPMEQDEYLAPQAPSSRSSDDFQ